MIYGSDISLKPGTISLTKKNQTLGMHVKSGTKATIARETTRDPITTTTGATYDEHVTWWLTRGAVIIEGSIE
ncbi:hypothetical protein Scep_022424 [Stephania cephalantha]|uniref:Uncharacterized protein n=1 Tax=Stephania cephalantha TaxID=152367 RepID=A0AAP0F5C9_9MAGN